MPDTDGFGATAEISRIAPDVAVLILTMSDDDGTVTRAMRSGARGYLLKGATKEEILRAVTAVADGKRSSDLPSPNGYWPDSVPHLPTRTRSPS